MIYYHGNENYADTAIYKVENIDGVDFYEKETVLTMYGYYEGRCRYLMKYDKEIEGLKPNRIETNKEKTIKFMKNMLFMNMKEECEKKKKKPRTKAMHFRLRENDETIFDSRRDIGMFWKLPETTLRAIIDGLDFGNGKYEPQYPGRDGCLGTWNEQNEFKVEYVAGYIKHRDGSHLKKYRKIEDNKIYSKEWSPEEGRIIELYKPEELEIEIA